MTKPALKAAIWIDADACPNTIKAKLTMRDFMDTLRGSGIHGGGLAQLGEPEKRRFANALDSFLARAAGSA